MIDRKTLVDKATRAYNVLKTWGEEFEESEVYIFNRKTPQKMPQVLVALAVRLLLAGVPVTTIADIYADNVAHLGDKHLIKKRLGKLVTVYVLFTEEYEQLKFLVEKAVKTLPENSLADIIHKTHHIQLAFRKRYGITWIRFSQVYALKCLIHGLETKRRWSEIELYTNKILSAYHASKPETIQSG
ncbi:MAG: hypothetical protein QXJ23_09685 [Thermofilum sp.]|uniref:hypothetical protein n=1 Tax=Thermofilum sp. TaxID=1961369 RepID=UPI003173CFB0